MIKRTGIMITVVLIGMVTIIFFSMAEGQSQKVILRYKGAVQDIRKYDCILETETERSYWSPNPLEPQPDREKHLSWIKSSQQYEITEITPEGNFKTISTKQHIETKAVNIRNGEKTEDYYSGGKPSSPINIYTPRGELLKSGGFVRPITTTLHWTYKGMVKTFLPVMPEGEVGMNDTWTYPVGILIGPEYFLPNKHKPITTTLITYKVIGFEKNNGYDCVKIEYAYEFNPTEAMQKSYLIQQGISEDKVNEIYSTHRGEVIIKGKGTIYFAYNEGILISRKENLFHTENGDELVNGVWKPRSKHTERFGFTMNYIKP